MCILSTLTQQDFNKKNTSITILTAGETVSETQDVGGKSFYLVCGVGSHFHQQVRRRVHERNLVNHLLLPERQAMRWRQKFDWNEQEVSFWEWLMWHCLWETHKIWTKAGVERVIKSSFRYIKLPFHKKKGSQQSFYLKKTFQILPKFLDLLIIVIESTTRDSIKLR